MSAPDDELPLMLLALLRCEHCNEPILHEDDYWWHPHNSSTLCDDGDRVTPKPLTMADVMEGLGMVEIDCTSCDGTGAYQQTYNPPTFTPCRGCVGRGVLFAIPAWAEPTPKGASA